MKKCLRDYDLYATYRKWVDGCGVFECFVRSTCFVTLKHYGNFIIPNIQMDEDEWTLQACEIMQQYKHDGTLFFIDAPNSLALKTSFIVHQKYALQPILTFRHICHPFGLVGDEEAIGNMLIYGEQLLTREKQGFIFVLDSKRYGAYEDEVIKEYFNNQYELTEFDLPPVEMLHDLGYKSVVFVAHQVIKADVEAYLQYLHDNGITCERFVL